MRLLSSDPVRRLTVLAGAAVLAVTLTACGGDDDPAADPTADPTASSSAAPTDAGDPATDPNSPFVVAASAVAQRSRDQVTQLHVMGVSTSPDGQLPRDQVPGLAKAIRTELTDQIADCTMMAPPEDSAAAALVASLREYRTLATQLAAWDPDGKAAMPAAWFDQLQGTDRDWKAALRDLGQLSDQDLLSGLAPLMMPTEGAA